MKISAHMLGYGDVKIELPEKSIEILTNIIKEALTPAVSEVGELLQTIPAFFNYLLAPYQEKFAERKHEKSMLIKRLHEKYNAIPTKDKVIPDESFLISARDTLPYVLSNQNLKDMFATLFGNAMLKEKTYSSTPLFMDILHNISPQDALNIKRGRYLEFYRPLIRIFECVDLGIPDEEMHNAGMTEFYSSPHKIPVFSHYSLAISDPPENENTLSISIYNLHRHELINVDYIERIIYANDYSVLYNQLIKGEFWKRCKEHALKNHVHLCLTRGYTSPTDLGKLFFEVCCE